MLTRAALYARISTQEGRQHLDSQMDALREFAGRMHWTVVNEFTDQVSGHSRRRPGLERMLEAAARRSFDIVAVHELSRLTRRGITDAFEIIERLDRSQVEFWSITQEMFRTVGPAGKLLVAIAAYIAESETAVMRSRIKAGLERARKNGKKLGHEPIPLNLDQVARLYDSGLSLRKVAKQLGVSHATIDRRLRQHDAENRTPSGKDANSQLPNNHQEDSTTADSETD